MKKFHKTLIINRIYQLKPLSLGYALIFTLMTLFLFSCSPKEPKASEAELEKWDEWKVKRLENLKAPGGFLNLAGLFWLEQGSNSFGSSPDNDLVFPSALPGEIGSFILLGNQVIVELKERSGVLIDSIQTDKMIVFDLDSGLVKQLTWKNYQWYIIERSGNIGVRIKDMEHPKLSLDIDLNYYEYDPAMNITAIYTPYADKKIVRFDNVLNMTYEMEIPGQIKFKVDGRDFTLEPIASGQKLFIIFSDETSAIETYGGGRYLYTDKPVENEPLILNFNMAYNPPCVFTAYATCLLPPKENQLEIEIRAGEKDYHLD